MEFKTEKLEGNRAKLTVTVPKDVFEKSLDRAFKAIVGRINVPGFRRGKAPRHIVDKLYGREVYLEDAIKDAIPAAFSGALDEAGADFECLVYPDYEVVSCEKGEGLVFSATYDLKPEVKLGKYKGMKLEAVDEKLPKDAVKNEIKAMQERFSRVEITEDALAEGDTAVIDFVGSIDGKEFEGGSGEKFPLVLGSGQFIPGYEEQLVGHKAGEVVNVEVTFPKDYSAKDLAGKKALFVTTIREGKKKILAELNDDFAQDVSECKNMKELEAQVKEELTKKYQETAQRTKENLAIAKTIELSKCEIPKSMIDLRLDQLTDNFANQIGRQGLTLEQYLQLTGAKMEDLRNQFVAQAESELKTEFVLDAVATAEKIAVEDKDLDEEYAKMAEDMHKSFEEVKELYGSNPTMVESLKFNKKLNGAIKVLVDNATFDAEAPKKTTKKKAADTEEKPAAKKTTKKATEEKAAAKKTTKKETTEEEKPAAKKRTTKKKTEE